MASDLPASMWSRTVPLRMGTILNSFMGWGSGTGRGDIESGSLGAQAAVLRLGVERGGQHGHADGDAVARLVEVLGRRQGVDVGRDLVDAREGMQHDGLGPAARQEVGVDDEGALDALVLGGIGEA